MESRVYARPCHRRLGCETLYLLPRGNLTVIFSTASMLISWSLTALRHQGLVFRVPQMFVELFLLDQILQFHQPVKDHLRPGRTSGDVYVHGDDLCRFPLHGGIIVVEAASACTGAEGPRPTWVRTSAHKPGEGWALACGKWVPTIEQENPPGAGEAREFCAEPRNVRNGSRPCS